MADRDDGDIRQALGRIEQATKSTEQLVRELKDDQNGKWDDQRQVNNRLDKAVASSNGIHANHEARIKTLESSAEASRPPAVTGWGKAPVFIAAGMLVISCLGQVATLIIALAHA